MTETMIVRYLMAGTFRATRHAEGCAHLRRALRDQERAQSQRWPGGGYDALLVMTEGQYAAAGGRPPPKDCRCVDKATIISPDYGRGATGEEP